MHDSDAAEHAASPKKTARDWMKILAAYREPHHGRSALELAITLIPFFALWFAAAFAVRVNYWLPFLFSIPAAVFLVRIFIIQHDCGHGSFFRNKALNNWVGRALGILTMTPYDVWKRSHAIHHASSGNLDKRGTGDIAVLTVREYQNKSKFGQFMYRLYRHPLTLFVLGPFYIFVIRQRLPENVKFKHPRQWLSAMATNAAIACVVFLVIYVFGLKSFLIVYLPITIMASTIGVWMFYVQHQFEDTQWDDSDEWSMHEAALHGSSFYDLPGFLRWLTGNIGIHHVHHLYARIPFYRLPKVLKENPALGEIKRVTLWESFKCANLKLWDEGSRRLVTYKQARAIMAAV
ncbi:MAG: fatty acid desaturase [Robiginitomaculum sp.]